MKLRSVFAALFLSTGLVAISSAKTIVDIAAGVDGQRWPEGTGPGQVEIEGNNPIVITWHLSPTSDAVQNFTLSYRALGVVRRD